MKRPLALIPLFVVQLCCLSCNQVNDYYEFNKIRLPDNSYYAKQEGQRCIINKYLLDKSIDVEFAYGENKNIVYFCEPVDETANSEITTFYYYVGSTKKNVTGHYQENMGAYKKNVINIYYSQTLNAVKVDSALMLCVDTKLNYLREIYGKTIFFKDGFQYAKTCKGESYIPTKIDFSYSLKTEYFYLGSVTPVHFN